MDTNTYGEYNLPWSTADGKNESEYESSFNAGGGGGGGDKLNQSSASIALDDMVSRIIDDDTQSLAQGFSSPRHVDILWHLGVKLLEGIDQTIYRWLYNYRQCCRLNTKLVCISIINDQTSCL